MLRRRAAALKLKTEALASKARSWLHDKPGSLAWVPLASIANRYKFYLRQTMQIRMRRTGFAAMFLDATRRNLMGTNHLITKAALIANGVAMMLVYPLNMMVLERTSWIWDAPSRNPPLEHMLVAVYVTMGAFLIWAARDPVRFLPLHRASGS